MTGVVLDEYNGKPTIGLPTGVKKDGTPYLFSFGTGKAKAILTCLAEIKAFVAENDPSFEIPE
jgi:hypothetical protein